VTHGVTTQVVLINGRTASTSELLAGALHDEYPALLLGERTFGKGRTQRVLPLKSGDTLLVSTAQYSMPHGAPVDKVGLAPDVACVPEEVVGEQWQAGEVGPGSLLDDPCIVEAAKRLAAGPAVQAAV
jgi:C-terminal processing protease CtpA/Prc